MNSLKNLLLQIFGVPEIFDFCDKYSHTTGSHMVYKHQDGRRTTIPHHAGEEIGPGLLNKIIKKDLGITRKEFLKFVK